MNALKNDAAWGAEYWGVDSWVVFVSQHYASTVGDSSGI